MVTTTTRALIQARLQADIDAGHITTLTGVQGAGPLFQEVPSPQPKMAYVARFERKAERPTDIGRHVEQIIQETYAIYLCAHHLADQVGAESNDEIEAMGAEVQASLLGWIPNTGGDHLAYVGGKLIDQRGACLVWAEFYTLTKVIIAN